MAKKKRVNLLDKVTGKYRTGVLKQGKVHLSNGKAINEKDCIDMVDSPYFEKKKGGES